MLEWFKAAMAKHRLKLTFWLPCYLSCVFPLSSPCVAASLSGELSLIFYSVGRRAMLMAGLSLIQGGTCIYLHAVFLFPYCIPVTVSDDSAMFLKC